MSERERKKERDREKERERIPLVKLMPFWPPLATSDRPFKHFTKDDTNAHNHQSIWKHSVERGIIFFRKIF
jgi:hypothetical protein